MKNFFAAMGSYNRQDLLAFVAEDPKPRSSWRRPFKDDWVFDITVEDGKVTNIREYIDTQAVARAAQMGA